MIDKMDQCYKDTALDAIKQMPPNCSYPEKAKFLQAKMLEKHPLPKWNCQVVRREQGFLSSFDETSQYLVVSFNGDRIDIFVIKTEIHFEPISEPLSQITGVKKDNRRIADELVQETAQARTTAEALDKQRKQSSKERKDAA